MKLGLFVLSLAAAVFARPGVEYQDHPATIPIQPSLGYLPGQTSTSTVIDEPSISYLPSGNYGPSGGFDNFYQDQKHVYFYAAPDDEPAAHFRVYVEPSSYRHTKIIFVKAPSYGGVIPEVIAPPSQAVDKTLVYVLVKKPHHDGSITVPASLGVKQRKPEVYFVKYHNKYEAKSAVDQGLAEQPVGANLEDLGNPHVFTKTLENHRGDVNGGVAADVDVRYGPPANGAVPYK